jgi:subtilisin family serine protease
MDHAGRLNPSTYMWILDGGFSSSLDDFPDLTVIFNADVENPASCTAGLNCPWHGTQVASVAAGQLDNGTGIAGTGGPAILKLDLSGSPNISSPVEIAEWILGLVENVILLGVGVGPDVINISAGFRLPAGAFILSDLIDIVTLSVYMRGGLIVAAAGNEGENVDEIDCFIACWEEAIWIPCENDMVLCVGGLSTTDRRKVHVSSNYGTESTIVTGTVDLYAPFVMYVPNITSGGETGSPEVIWSGGTSFSSPFVAGISALALRASEPIAGSSNLFTSVLQSTLIQSALMGAAYEMTHPKRYSVNALGTVIDMLELSGADLTPKLSIQAPDGTVLNWNGEDSILVEARYFDPRFDGDPVSIVWRWESGEEIGRGANQFIRSEGLDQGTHVLVAEDIAGRYQPSARIEIQVVNNPPEVELISSQLVFCSGYPVTARVRVIDPNEPEGFPTDRITWTGISAENGITVDLGFGAELSRVLDSGEWVIQAAATDPQGLRGTDSVTVTVADCADAPPSLQIIAPEDGSRFATIDMPIQLRAMSNDPEDGDLSNDIRWYTNRSEQHPDDSLGDLFLHALIGHPIGQGSSISIDLVPTRDGEPHTITARVLDSSGNTASDQIDIDVYVQLY